MSSCDDQDIVIIGMSCRFPGAKDYHQYWDNLLNSRNHVQEITPDRWDMNDYYSPNLTDTNKCISKWGGLIDGIKNFDNQFFGILPEEARNMDPQHRCLLQEVWRCVEDAGISLNILQNTLTSVYTAITANDYLQIMARKERIEPYACIGNYACILANRISHVLGLRGPSRSIDTACSSSLVILHDAKKALQIGDCDYAIVGAANIICHPWHNIAMSKCRALSPEGQCKTFDMSANGYVRSDGVAALLVITRKNALQRSHPIYAIVKGSSINHGGTARTLSTPSVQAQKEVIEAAIRDARISPDQIEYLEAHGTGTSLGDAIEFNALQQVFLKNQRKIYLGSVKTNIGHLEAAAGMAGIIKVLLMLRYNLIPQHLNVNKLNPMIDLDNSSFILSNCLVSWEKKKEGHYAGISSFGLGGVNSHVIIQEYIPKQSKIISPPIFYYPFLLSAKSKGSLQKQLVKWENYAQTDLFDKIDLPDLVLTLSCGREHLQHRFGGVVSHKNEIIRKVQNQVFSQSKRRPIVFAIGSFKKEACQNIDLIAEKVLTLLEKQQFNKYLSTTCLNSPSNNLGKYYASYCLSKFFILMNIQPFLIVGEEIGQLVSYTVSGAIDLSTALGVLVQNDQKVLVGNRPRWPLLDVSSERFTYPIEITKEYSEYLQDKIAGISEIEDALLLRIRQLLENQFTFKKIISSMEQLLKKYDCSLLALFSDTKKGRQNLQNDQIAAINLGCLFALNELYQKYGLTRNFYSKYSVINEMLNLIEDKIIKIDEAFSILRNPFDSAVLSILKQNVQNLDFKKSCKYFNAQTKRKLNYNYDPFAQITNRSLAAFFEKSSIICIGHVADIGMSHFFVNGEKDLFLDCLNVLVNLWQQGEQIAWDRYADYFLTGRSYVNLPTYEFEDIPFWCKANVGMNVN